MIIFLYGEDSFRSGEKLVEIKNKFLEKTSSGSIPSVVDYEDPVRKDFFESAGSSGLFSEKSLIIVKNMLAETKKEEQEKILEQFKEKKYLADDKNTVLVFWEKNSPKKSKLLEYLLKNSKNQKLEKLNGIKFTNWIIERLKKYNHGAAMGRVALEKLMAYAGEDMFKLDNEIKKLASFKEEGEIGAEDIELLVKANVDANIFQTIEALSSGNKKTALKLLHNQIAKGEDPFYIFSMYVYQFRNLLKIADFFQKGINDRYIIAKETKLHPFVVQKGLAQLRNFDFERLKNIYGRLQIIDTKIKTGKIDIKLALDKFVAEM